MAEILNVFPYRYAKQTTPVVITETQGFQEFLTLDTDIPAGIYDVTVSFVALFTTATDVLNWNATGSIASPTFVHGDGAIGPWPFSYTFPMEHAGGNWATTLQGQIAGPGVADVTISVANIRLKKQAELP